MKRTFIILALLLASGITLLAQSTATDFTANDCNGNPHHLFAELDAGKVIVISFVMPCGTCIGPSQSAKTEVAGFASSHPGKVVFYLADDFGNNSCAALTNWADENGMSGVTKFATPAVTEIPYGSGGMPKIVVLAGTDHKVYMIQNSTLNATTLRNAINTAITATTGFNDSEKLNFNLQAYPNPAADKLAIQFTLPFNSSVSVDIFNLLGAKVQSLPATRLATGKKEMMINLENLSNGIYFVKLNADQYSQILKFNISR